MADLRLLRDNFMEFFIGIMSVCLLSSLIPLAFYLLPYLNDIMRFIK